MRCPGGVNEASGPVLFGRRMFFLESVDSTQDVANRLASDGAPAGTVVAADVQRKGRGRRDAAWHSPPGGLWMSVVLRPGGNAHPALFTLAGALAVALAAEKTCRARARIKWPNDCLVNGRKVAGVMGEKSGGALILGIGVNLNVDRDFLERVMPGEASSLAWEAGRPVDREAFLGNLLAELESLYFKAERGVPGSIIRSAKEYSSVLGRRVRGVSRGMMIEGTAEDFGPDGSLIITLFNGAKVKFSAGELRIGSRIGQSQ